MKQEMANQFMPQHSRKGEPSRFLIAGVGNELLCDDGVGIHAIRELQREPIPGVTMVDLGTAILHGLGFLEAADRVLVIDAAKGGQAPGTIYLFEAGVNTQAQPMTSVHSMGLREAAGLLMAGQAPPMTVLGVEPESFKYSMSLSDPVQAAVARVVSLARETITAWRQAERNEEMAVPAEV